MELYYKINLALKNIIVGMFKLIIQQYMNYLEVKYPDNENLD